MMMETESKEKESTEMEEISFKVEEQAESLGILVFDSSEKKSSEDEVVSENEVNLDADDEDLTAEFLAEISSAEESIEASSDDGEVGLQAEETPTVDGLGLSEELTIMGKIEAVLFASPKPLRTVEIHELIMDQGYDLKQTQDALDELTEFYRDRAGGFHLKYIKRMGYQFQTTSAAKTLMEKQFSSRPRPLSRASLETLAVVAYRQKSSKVGVTRAEVEFIRGVDAGSIFKTLIERNLLSCVGRKEIPGRPMMFGVTDEFLKVFQLGSINDLPPLESFQTPTDVIAAANKKIEQFEAEQGGVNPEEFIGDEVYTENLGDSEFDILAAQVPPYAPSLERLDEVRSEVQHAIENEMAINNIPAEVLAEMAADSLQDTTAEEKAAETLKAEEIAVPPEVIEDLSVQQALFDYLDEGDKAFASTQRYEPEERSIAGATIDTQGLEDDEFEGSSLLYKEEEPQERSSDKVEFVTDELEEAPLSSEKPSEV